MLRVGSDGASPSQNHASPFRIMSSPKESVPAVRKPLHVVAVLGLVVVGLLGALRWFVDRRGPTPQNVRHQMYAALRAGRLAECQAALVWLGAGIGSSPRTGWCVPVSSS